MYSGKELESKKAKHRRYRLKDKVTYGGIEGADDFGERLYIRGEEKLSLSLARNLLLISDGARWISDIAGADYLKATYQLDWWHYEKKLRAALPGELKLQQELKEITQKRSMAIILLINILTLPNLPNLMCPVSGVHSNPVR